MQYGMEGDKRLRSTCNLKDIKAKNGTPISLDQDIMHVSSHTLVSPPLGTHIPL